jgi:hypothetical protein
MSEIKNKIIGILEDYLEAHGMGDSDSNTVVGIESAAEQVTKLFEVENERLKGIELKFVDSEKAYKRIFQQLKSSVVIETVYRPKCDESVEVVYFTDIENIFGVK